MEPVPEQALDIQHDTDPAEDHGAARRIPHLGHAILFLSLVWFFIRFFGMVVLSVANIVTEQQLKEHPGFAILAQTSAYIATLLVSAWLFPRIWQRPFLNGIQWNALAFRRFWYVIIPTAIVVSIAAQYSDIHFFPTPDDQALLNLMHSQRGVWFVTALGVLIAPLLEETAFRGFLLPAFATAYDWLALDRTPAGLQRWQSTSMHSRSAYIFSAVFSSIPFVLIHADQLAHAWGALSVLYAVSLVLSTVRIRTHSLACSVAFHATYNLTIFVAIFIQTGGYRHLDRI